jgi:DNA-binding MarR family transcriptional regulator
MSDGQFAVLAALSVHGPHTLGELAERERVRAVDEPHRQLPRRVRVPRPHPDDDDRRKVNIALTESGREVVTETVRRRDQWLVDILEGLDDDQRHILAQAAVIMGEVAAR